MVNLMVIWLYLVLLHVIIIACKFKFCVCARKELTIVIKTTLKLIINLSIALEENNLK